MKYPLSHFIAPQLLQVEDAAAPPGTVCWVTAFTSSVVGWPKDRLGATHLHRCHFRSRVDRWQQVGPVEWRIESQPLGLTWPPVLRVVQGEAETLQAALKAASTASQSQPDRHDDTHFNVLIGPAFVALKSESGLPRVWGCAAFTIDIRQPAIQPWSHSQICFIRERRDAPGTRFACSLEIEHCLESSSQVKHWMSDSLSEAVESCGSAMRGEDEAAQGGNNGQAHY
jgi:hypothetical protein